MNPSSSSRPLMILIAGPYRSGTNDDPVRMRENLRVLETAALPVYRAGHIPVIGEWLALPLLEAAGSKRIGDEFWEEIVYPIAHRLLDRCDAVLRRTACLFAAFGDSEVRMSGPARRVLSDRNGAARIAGHSCPRQRRYWLHRGKFMPGCLLHRTNIAGSQERGSVKPF
jgi:hypothetical protein